MERQLLAISCCIYFILLFASKGFCNDNSIEIIHSEHAKMVKMYEALNDGQDSKPITEAALKADSRIRNAIKRLFKESNSLEDVKTKTSGIVKWYEWPINVSDTRRWDFVFADSKRDPGGSRLYDKILRINYRHCEAEDGTDVYVMQNCFWTKHGQMAPLMYAIIKANARITMSPLLCTDDDEVAPCCLTGGSSNLFFLGFVHRYPPLPDILVLNGPEGSGEYSTCLLYSYNVKKKCWESRGVAGSQGATEFSYDERSNILRYKCAQYSESLGKEFQEDRVFMICDKNSTLRLKISLVPGAIYTKEKALLNVTFENIGEEVVKIGKAFASEKTYAGTFFIDVRKKDGTRVFNVPKVEVQVSHYGRSIDLEKKQKHSVQVDIAECYNIRRLEKGWYEVYFEYINHNQYDSNCFSGIVGSNKIDLYIQN